MDEHKNKQRSEKWLGKMTKMRPTRQVANEIDASACAMVNSINEKLVESQRVLLMISHSRAVKAAAKNTSLAQQAYSNIEARSGIRDLDYLWLYYVHKENTVKDTLKRVNDTIEMLRTFAGLRGRLSRREKSQEQILSAAEDTLQKCANLSLGATTVVSMLKWLDDTRKQLSWGYDDSAEVGRAILTMVREGGMSAELIARRDYEKNKFESLMQYITTSLSRDALTDS